MGVLNKRPIIKPMILFMIILFYISLLECISSIEANHFPLDEIYNIDLEEDIDSINIDNMNRDDCSQDAFCQSNRYSAIIYKANGYTYILDPIGNIIAKSDKNDASLLIQTAIDRMEAGTIIMRPGNYGISSTIIIKPDITLEMDNGAILFANKDINMIQIKPGGKIRGGKIDVSEIPFSKSIITLDGTDGFEFSDQTSIKEIILSTHMDFSSPPTGTAIYFKTRGTSGGHISGVLLRDISIYGLFNYGIYLDQDGRSDNWINGNLFDSIFAEGVRYFIYFNNVNGENTDGNIFTNLQYQSTELTESVLTIGGSNNQFNCMIWDWQVAKGYFAILLQKKSVHNYIISNSDSIGGHTSNNIIIRLNE